MHILSAERTVHELIQYFSFLQISLSETEQTRSLTPPVEKMLQKLQDHGRKMADIEKRQLLMRARANVCLFFLRKTLINLGKEIRKAEIALRTEKFYDSIIVDIAPGNQIPLQAQLQKFVELLETALTNFHRIPDHPKCDPIRSQRESIAQWLEKSRLMLEEYRNFMRDVEQGKAEYQNLQKEVKPAVEQLSRELMRVFDSNTSDVNQYFLTLAL